MGAASLRSLIAEQLALSARIVAGGNDVAPRFVLDSPTGRLTFTTWQHWKKDDKPLASGLLGPVTVSAAVKVSSP